MLFCFHKSTFSRFFFFAFFFLWTIYIFRQRSLSTDRHKIHMNLTLSLLLAQVLFLAGIKETSNQVSVFILSAFFR